LLSTALLMAPPSSCDEVLLDSKYRPATQRRDSYKHAQKMCAVMTYTFGRTFGLGSLPWQLNEVTRKMSGNPSVSEAVSLYMMSLRNRKVGPNDIWCSFTSILMHNCACQVCAGETSTSARAISPVSYPQINLCPGNLMHTLLKGNFGEAV